jgi:hypothetical protein
MEKRTINLRLATRLSLLSILPEKGDLTDMRCASELRQMLQFRKKEIFKFNIRGASNGGVQWDMAANKYTRQFTFDEHQLSLIKKTLEALKDKKELREDLTSVDGSIYDWFVENSEVKYVDVEDDCTPDDCITCANAQTCKHKADISPEAEKAQS